jgi:hypothetical protein
VGIGARLGLGMGDNLSKGMDSTMLSVILPIFVRLNVVAPIYFLKTDPGETPTVA